MKKLIHKTLIITLLIASSLNGYSQQSEPDQSQVETDYGFWFDINTIRWQEFIPTLNKLTSVAVFIGQQGDPGNIILEIETQSGIVIGQSVINEANVQNHSWNVFHFEYEINLTVGEIYKIYHY